MCYKAKAIFERRGKEQENNRLFYKANSWRCI